MRTLVPNIKLSWSSHLKAQSDQYSLIRGSWWASSIYKDFPKLNQRGVCLGLCVDYARHVLSHQNTNTESNYVQKLKRKFTTNGKSSRNFAKRIFMYQEYLQNHKGEMIIENVESIIKEKLNTSSIVGLGIYDGKEGHIIAISVIKNDEQEVIGYKVFDPNLGEFDCTTNKIIAENIKNFDEIIKNMLQIYNARGSRGYCDVSDLEKLVTQYELIKSKGQYEYQSENKYLDKNPNRQSLIDSYLFRSASTGNLEGVAGAIRMGANINVQIVDHFLARIQSMIKSGIVTTENPQGFTALGVAIINGNKKLVQLLLDNGADINIPSNGKNVLLQALFRDNEMLKLFLDKGFDINQVVDGSTLLSKAAFMNSKTKVQFLLDEGADVSKVANEIYYQTSNEIQEVLQAAKFKKKVIETLKTTNEDIKLKNEFLSFPPGIKTEVIRQVKLDIKKLAKEGKGYNIMKIISSFPVEKRMEFFADIAKEAIISCAEQNHLQKVNIILRAFPDEKDRSKILQKVMLTPLIPRAKVALVQDKLYQNLPNLRRMFSDASKTKTI